MYIRMRLKLTRLFSEMNVCLNVCVVLSLYICKEKYFTDLHKIFNISVCVCVVCQKINPHTTRYTLTQTWYLQLTRYTHAGHTHSSLKQSIRQIMLSKLVGRTETEPAIVVVELFTRPIKRSAIQRPRMVRPPSVPQLCLFTSSEPSRSLSEHTTHSQCSTCETARAEVSGVTQHRRRVWCTHTLQGLGWPIWTSWCTSESSSSIVALWDAVKMVGMAKLCPKLLTRARARAMEKLSVPFNLCTDLQGSSKTSWSRNLELSGVPKSAVGFYSDLLFFFTKVSRTMVTVPTCL